MIASIALFLPLYKLLYCLFPYIEVKLVNETGVL